ncbi:MULTISPECIES: nucleoside-diphosphate kinase [Enterococcus]|uniref:Nucleoside diphosphate kinase n=1 Tax=Enterococcus diestrammenae TaxID=1155073 RepID=A0ABV0F0S0_9ENTE|nr:nucleoside-diphosphate kinase [Enterococcus diestrammenae]KAF1300296.1 nucleoside-diphosphate kinase [Enterococcus diestrammenae]HIX71106.1 nucleoside-diphosphate kinase [Candidatus Enterococcus stercoravium]
MEQTLVIIKPDGVRRKLVGRIIQRFEDRQLTITAMRVDRMSRDLAKVHYAHLQEKPFFEEILEYMTSGPVIYLVLEADNAVALVRGMVGFTDGLKATPGTIRGDFAINKDENVVHASDCPEAARNEIQRFFGAEAPLEIAI